MENDFLNIYCPSCGSPAKFDIVNQIYNCQYCGGKVEVQQAIKSKQELRDSIALKLKQSAESYPLEVTNCTGCGSTLVFLENEATSTCDFCGRSLVRKKYTNSEKIPETIIPFALTKKEAKERLEKWCSDNKEKEEAKLITRQMDKLEGYYLPYNYVMGPVVCDVKKTGQYNSYQAYGYLKNEFVNCSEQLDNLLLDAMEPYDLNDLKEFDYKYVASLRVKISDIDETIAKKRLEKETKENYREKLEKIWGSKAIDIKVDASNTINTATLLPVYYLKGNNILASVNGQTGKVSVKAIKESKFTEYPWWSKGLLVLLSVILVTFIFAYVGLRNLKDALTVVGYLSIYYLIVFVCMFEKGDVNKKIVVKYHQIFTSDKELYQRKNGKLVLRDENLERKIEEPVFLKTIKNKVEKVTYVFNSPKRTIKTIIIGIIIIFLPVIVALFLNGFNISNIDLSGSIVWFCLSLPLVPILYIQKSIKNVYENPLIYLVKKDGKLVKYNDTVRKDSKEKRKLSGIEIFLYVFVIIIFCMSVYLTGFPE